VSPETTRLKIPSQFAQQKSPEIEEVKEQENVFFDMPTNVR